MYTVAAAIVRFFQALVRVRFTAAVATLLVCMGVLGVAWAVLTTADADWYLFLGALVSCAFSLVVIVCYARTRVVRAHPNPLILSKSLVDLLLALLYIFEYTATEFRSSPVQLPERIAALTQALLVCGEFWFFAMPVDMVQSITNPFTSYAHNNRVYWFYSLLSGAICGVVLWLFDDQTSAIGAGDDDHDHVVGRFFWFHENTDRPGFWWHHWLSYHMWVLVYLIFATICVLYVKRRLKRGLEETFDVRRRVLSSGLLTCWIYITWSLAVLGLFVLTNLPIVQQTLPADVYEDLVNVSAFLHAARGCLNIIVWLVINATSLHAVCWRSMSRRHRRALADLAAVTTSRSASMDTESMIIPEHSDDESSDDDDKTQATNPELNTVLRRQMIQLATTGIVESVQHYHRLHRRIASNQTFSLDWQKSPQHQREQRQLSASMSLAQVVATRNSTIRVVEADDEDTAAPRRHIGLSAFLPMRMKEMQFYDFQPRVFASVRQLHGIQDNEYVYAFRATVNERLSEGRSGAFVFTTCDRKYLVKSTTAAEKNVLLRLLPSYVRYLKWNPRTLLPKFLGFHAMKLYGQVFYFVVMANVLNTNEVIHRRYDIKGSWVDRNAPACVLGEKYRCSKCNRFFVFGATAGPSCEPVGAEHYPDVTLRDNDLKKRVKLEPDVAAQLVKQLTRDSNFLASLGIMDYSLLIGAHYSHFTITSESTDSSAMHKAPSAQQLPTVTKQEPERDGVHEVPLTVRRQSTMGEATTITRSDPAEASGYVHNLCADQDDDEAGVDMEASDSSNVLTASTTAVDVVASASTTHNVRTPHRYRAHQVSGPSTYYFGLVDILQQWTLAKQVERVYKVHVLRKAPRGVSAIAPRAYAQRFQQKMQQLLITVPTPPNSLDEPQLSGEDRVLPSNPQHFQTLAQGEEVGRRV